MDKSLRQRTADLVVKAAMRTLAQWQPPERRKAPFTGAAEFLQWIKNLELEIRTFREPTPEVHAIRDWLQLTRDVIALSELAEEVRQGKRPAVDFGKATHIEGAIQRVVFAALRVFHAAKLGTKTEAEAIEKIQASIARLEESLQQHAARGNARAHPTITQEVSVKVKEVFEAAGAALKP